MIEVLRVFDYVKGAPVWRNEFINPAHVISFRGLSDEKLGNDAFALNMISLGEIVVSCENLPEKLAFTLRSRYPLPTAMNQAAAENDTPQASLYAVPE